MKGTTMVWLGVRHVGDSALPDESMEVSALQAMHKIAGVLAKQSMKSRFEFFICRSEEDLAGCMGPRGKKQSMTNDEIDSLFAEFEAE